MKNTIIKHSINPLRNCFILLAVYLSLVNNTFATGDTHPKSVRTSKTVLPPPTPTVTLTLPPSAGSTCFSVLTASGCGTATTYWYTGNSFYSSANPLTVNTNTPLLLKAVCYDGTFGDYSAEYKAISATFTQITPAGPLTICSSGSTTLNASSAFSGLTYQWYRNSSFLTGATGSSYNATTAGTYTVTASNGSCNSTSTNAVSVTVNTPTTPIISPSFTGTCGSQSITMSTQSGLVGTFQWNLNGTAISGATSSSYSTSVVGSYTVDFTSNGCTVTSMAYVFAQNATPTITLNSAVSPSCSSTLSATGCNGIVNWQRNLGGNWTAFTNGNPINVPVSTNPSEFRATCNSNGCVSSPSNVLKGTPNNFVEITPISSTICAGSSVTLNASSATSGLNYQWLRNSSTISGATSSSYVATLSGQYTLTATSGSCSFTSAAATVTVNTPPSVSISSSSGSSPLTIVNGQSVTLNANGCSGGTILWSNSATSSSITVSPSSNATYSFTCTQSPCIVNSSDFVINVNPLPPPTITSSAASTCTGTSVSITGVCPNSSTISWNTSPVQTTATITVSPSTATSYTATCTLNSATSSASISIGVFDGAITSLSSGDWTNPATWSCNCIPAPCNDVTVEVGHIVNIPVSLTGRLNNLTVKGSVDLKNQSTMKMK
jgi:hypothetical protein